MGDSVFLKSGYEQGRIQEGASAPMRPPMQAPTPYAPVNKPRISIRIRIRIWKHNTAKYSFIIKSLILISSLHNEGCNQQNGFSFQAT